MSNIKDTFRDLANLFGLSDKEADELFKSFTYKEKVNGKTIVDIENGIDKLKKSHKKAALENTCVSKEDCSAKRASEKPKTYSTTSTAFDKPLDGKVPETYNEEFTPKTFTSTSTAYDEDIPKKKLWEDCGKLSESVCKSRTGFYSMRHFVKGTPINENTDLCFETQDDQYVYPGITNEQLLTVVKDRFKDYPMVAYYLQKIENELNK